MTFIELTDVGYDNPPVFVVFEKIAALRVAYRYDGDQPRVEYTEVHLDTGHAIFVKQTPEEIGKLADKALRA